MYLSTLVMINRLGNSAAAHDYYQHQTYGNLQQPQTTQSSSHMQQQQQQLEAPYQPQGYPQQPSYQPLQDNSQSQAGTVTEGGEFFTNLC